MQKSRFPRRFYLGKDPSFQKASERNRTHPDALDCIRTGPKRSAHVRKRAKTMKNLCSCDLSDRRQQTDPDRIRPDWLRTITLTHDIAVVAYYATAVRSDYHTN